MDVEVAVPADAESDVSAEPTSRRRRIVFWICRYLPAEIAGTAAMVVAGLAVTFVTDSPVFIALAALVGEGMGFYAVLAVTVYAEQRAVVQGPQSRRRTAARTLLLLIAEFGPAELLDTLLVRPAALIAGVWLLSDPVWGMLAGKLVADLIFYVVAAGAFTVTERTGLRTGERRRRSGQTVP
jgi:hypothetical protein